MNRKNFLKKSGLLVGSTLLSANWQIPFDLNSNASRKLNDLWKYSGIELSKLIKKKDITISEVIQAHLERIEEVNPLVNAISANLAEHALNLAKENEKELRSGKELSPLFGIPFSVKDNIDLRGFATTNGVSAFVENIAQEDAPHVKSMKIGGAIPLVRTNMPDFALRYHTKSQTIGQTINPWNRESTCGGSSGGDAVAVATGMVPIGLGNDYGGSLRYPAQCNGVCAIRPTRGAIPYISSSLPNNMPYSVRMFAVHGPIARTVTDLEEALKIMSKPDSRDAFWNPIREVNNFENRFKIAIISNPGNYGIDESIRSAIMRAAEILENSGYIVEEIDSNSLRESQEIWAQIVTTDIRNLFYNVLKNYASEEAVLFIDSFLKIYPELDFRQYTNILARVNGIATDWSLRFQNYDAIIGPISSREPFKVGFDIQGELEVKQLLESQALTVTANLLGLPSLVLPIQITNRIPQSIQIICATNEDMKCIRIAEEIEKSITRFTPIEPASQ